MDLVSFFNKKTIKNSILLKKEPSPLGDQDTTTWTCNYLCCASCTHHMSAIKCRIFGSVSADETKRETRNCLVLNGDHRLKTVKMLSLYLLEISDYMPVDFNQAVASRYNVLKSYDPCIVYL